MRRTASARTKTQCLLYKISRQKLLSILRDFPDTLRTMKRVASSRQRRLQHYIEPDRYPLLPEDEVDAEDCKTELFGADAESIVNVKEEENSRAMMKARHSHRFAMTQSFPGRPFVGKKGRAMGPLQKRG